VFVESYRADFTARTGQCAEAAARNPLRHLTQQPDAIDQTVIARTAVFGVQFSLFRVLETRGIEPLTPLQTHSETRPDADDAGWCDPTAVGVVRDGCRRRELDAIVDVILYHQEAATPSAGPQPRRRH
jgi:hypothetical protein